MYLLFWQVGTRRVLRDLLTRASAGQILRADELDDVLLFGPDPTDVTD